ncbi:DUF4184 family protein [Uliginosibacterium sp. H3]|uniref:DUF4184 family protein n=1 Tax=Uliginosibacterium silvisoli TaxID=3114758 RepID=A0ABU6K0B0_9RHOO|nr:DUF4184 family protein [Uliginosibacterium sp. H3]
MPFTVSHAAAVLPLRRYLPTLPLTAMVIGSMVPDFAFLIPHLDRHLSHSFAGLFLFCLPMGWLAQWLFWRGLQGPLLDLVPRPLQRRLQTVLGRESRSLLHVSAALLVGSLSHIAWDGFTHVDGFVAHAWPWLRYRLFMLGEAPLLVCDVLQHASSALGLVALAMYACRWFSRSSPGEARAMQYRVFWALAFLMVPMSAGLLSVLARLPLDEIERVAAMAAARSLQAAGVCLLAYALWWHRRHGLQHPKRPGALVRER